MIVSLPSVCSLRRPTHGALCFRVRFANKSIQKGSTSNTLLPTCVRTRKGSLRSALVALMLDPCLRRVILRCKVVIPERLCPAGSLLDVNNCYKKRLLGGRMGHPHQSMSTKCHTEMQSCATGEALLRRETTGCRKLLHCTISGGPNGNRSCILATLERPPPRLHAL